MSIPSVISLFSGAGGLDYGFEAAGFKTRVALELNADCCRTLRTNRPWPVIEADVMQVSSKEILRAGRLDVGEADVLIGGPPCQPFSKAGYWARGDSLRLDDPRSNTLSAYLRVLGDTLPKAFVLENVEGLAYSSKDEGLQLLLVAIDKINRRSKADYKISFKVLNAAEFGVPQVRHRLILVGTRDGVSFSFPSATHSDRPGQGGALQRFRTAWDAIGDLEPFSDEDLAMRGKWADLLPSIPEGKNYLFHTDRDDGEPLFGWRRRYWSFLLKLAKNLPSWTIQAQPGPAIGPFHWSNRRLSSRELCRLQTFPDDVVISGSRTAVQKQLGNAVPSLLAEVIAREIRSQVLGKSVSGPLRLMPPARAKTPGPDPVRPVPRKFLALCGDHSAHPGTGRGALASQRLRPEA